MIEEGDKVMVCMSAARTAMRCWTSCSFAAKRAPIRFDLVAVNLDQKQPGLSRACAARLPDQCGRALPHRERDTYSIVKRLIPRARPPAACARACAAAFCTAWPTNWAPPRSPWATTATTCWPRCCSTCFWRQAQEHAAEAGERRRPPRGDPPPGLCGREGHHAVGQGAPVPHHPCNLCGSQENLQRKQVSEMLREWRKNTPAAWKTWPTPCKTWCPAICWTARCTIL